MRFFVKLFCLLIGLFFCGVGTAFSVRAVLGTSPIAAPPVVFNEMMPKYSLGFWTVVFNAAFIFIQMFLLRKNFSLKHWGQFPALFIYGFFVDAGMKVTSLYVPNVYWLQILGTLAGCVFMGVGIGLELHADLTYLSGDGLVSVITNKYKMNLGKVKIFFDVCCVGIAVVFACAFMDCKINSIREGTLIAAFLVGPIINWTMKKLK
ncbi:MAG: DUF6198 family protein [Alphaproteobacteria bacterium]|nr:DUF6198 family protein [Alphaproteobacteria bacterium]